MNNNRIVSIGICWDTNYLFNVYLFKDCGEITYPQNGSVIMNLGSTFGQIARYSCKKGFNLIGNEFSICTANGTWTKAPVCEAKGMGSFSFIFLEKKNCRMCLHDHMLSLS